MKFAIITAIIAGLYFTGVWQKAEAVYRTYEQQQLAQERKELTEFRDISFDTSFLPSQQCMRLNKAALKELECKQEKQAAKRVFDEKFEARLATGWKPEK